MKKKSLKTEYPLVAAEWHPTKNGTLKPEDVTAGSGKKVWWLCSRCGNEWEATVYNRSRGNGCPYCSGRRVIPGETDLQTLRPDIAAEWHPTLNKTLIPLDVSANSHQKVWWLCQKCKEEWLASPNSRSQGHGCPKCSLSRIKAGIRSFASEFPDLAAEWHPTLNNVLKPNKVGSSSRKNVWWLCRKCGSAWQTTPAKRSKGQGCPYCSGRRVIPGETDLQTLRPDIAAEWDRSKNKLRPTEVSVSSAEKVYWICPIGHSYEAAVFSRTRGTGCPYCSGKKVLPGFNDLATLFPRISAEWDKEKNGDLTPADVTAHSSKRVWWYCPNCGREWQTTVATRTGSGKDLGCKCSGKRKSGREKEVDEKKVRELFKPLENDECPD